MWLIWIFAGLVVFFLLLFLLIVIFYRNKRTPHTRTPAEFGIPFEEIRFPTRNDKSLYGWWIPAEGEGGKRPVIILVHGWGRNVERTLPYIRALHPEGVHLLAFDSRHHGRSDADEFSSMLKFAEDLMAAMDYAQSRPEADSGRLGAVGLSIGGAAAVYAAGHDSRLRAAVTVGAFSHPVAVMRYSFRKMFLPYIPVVWAVLRYFEYRIGVRYEDIAPVNSIPNVSGKLLLIHGEEDKVVPLEEAKKLYAAAPKDRVELWVVPGKGHSNCHTHPEFWPKVHAFFRETLAQ